MKVSDKPWDGSASRWPDAASYADACLINENTGPRDGWVQSKCHLPVREPSSAYNRNAIRNALARIGQVQAASNAKAAALRTLNALKRRAKIG